MSKCVAVSKFAQPAQRHKWSAIKVEGVALIRDCLNGCGDWQEGTEIPISARRQFALESSVRERRIARRK